MENHTKMERIKRKFILISSIIIALCIGITYLIYLGVI